MVQRACDHPAETSVPPDDLGNISRESFDQELKLQPMDQDKSAAINNWLNSKICAMAC